MKLKKMLAVACATVLTAISTLSWVPKEPVLPVSAETATEEPEKQPRLYTDRVSAKPGDKKVPFTVYIDNNPCVNSYAFVLHPDPALKVVLSGRHPSEIEDVYEPLHKAGTVLQGGEDGGFLAANSYGSTVHRIGSASACQRDKTKTQNGSIFTYYFDIPDDTPAGVYPVFLDVDQILGYRGNDITDQFAVESGYIKVENTPTLDAPEIYGSFREVAPGDRHVPFTVSIRNNPGISGVNVQMSHGALLPHGKGSTVECVSGDVITDGKLITARYPASQSIAVSDTGGTASAKDGELFTCYFDIPDDLEDGYYPVTMKLNTITDGKGANAAGQFTVFNACFFVHNPDPYLPPTFYAQTVEANPGDKAVVYKVYMRNNPGLTKISYSVNHAPFDLSRDKIPNPGWVRAGMDTQMSHENYTFSVSASTDKPRIPPTEGYWGQYDGDVTTLYLDIPEDTKPGYYPINFTVHELNDGLYLDLMDNMVVENNYIKVGNPEGEPPVVTGTKRADVTPTTTVTTTTTAKPTTTTAKPTTTTAKATTTATKPTTTTAKATTTATKPTTTTAKATTTATKPTTTTAKATTTTAATTTTTTTTAALQATMPGDVDCNNSVDVSDVVLLARYLAEDWDAVISDIGKLNADCNHNGERDRDDGTLILQFVAKIIKSL